MKQLSLTILFFTFCHIGFSQTYGVASIYKLTEEFGQIYGTGFGFDFEIGPIETNFEKQLQSRVLLGLFTAKADRDVYDFYGLSSSRDAPLFPTTAKYKRLGVLTLTYSTIFKALKSSFSPFIGGDIILYTGVFGLEEAGGLITTNGPQAIGGGGIKPNIGLMYTHKDEIQFRLGIGKFLSAPYKSVKIQYWQTSLSCIFSL